MKFKTIPNWALNLAVFLIFQFVALICYFDPGFVLFRDDHVFLAERVYFPSDWDWLKHVVVFCQSRFTRIGDAFLFRPGTFFYTWVVDVLIREDRTFITQLSVALQTCGIFAIYWVLQRRYGKLLSFVVMLPFVLINDNAYRILTDNSSVFLTWFHVTPYNFGLPLLVLGMEFLERAKTNKNWAWLAALCNFSACLFVEFVPAVLGLIGGLFVLRWLFQRRKSPLWVGVVLPFAVYTSIFALVLATSGYPLFAQAPGEKLALAHSSSGYHWSFVKILSKVVELQFEFWTGGRLLVLFAALLLGILALGFKNRRSLPEMLKRNLTWVELSVVLGLLVLTFLELFRGDEIQHAAYHLPTFFMMLSILAAFVVASFLSQASKRTRNAILLTTFAALLVSHFKDKRIEKQWKAYKKSFSAPAADLLRIARFFDRNPEYCYGGVDLKTRPEKHNQFSIVLFEYSCFRRSGTPLVFAVTDKEPVQITARKLSAREESPKAPKIDLSDPIAVSEVPGLTWEAWKVLIDSPAAKTSYQKRIPKGFALSIPQAQLSKPMALHSIKATFVAESGFPILHNVGLIFDLTKDESRFAILASNFVHVLHVKDGKLQSQISTSLQKVSDQTSLEVVNESGRCYILVDGAITLSTDCPDGLRGTGTISFENGFQRERLESLTGSKSEAKSLLDSAVIEVAGFEGQ
jgi:hypothetical protein